MDIDIMGIQGRRCPKRKNLSLTETRTYVESRQNASFKDLEYGGKLFSLWFLFCHCHVSFRQLLIFSLQRDSSRLCIGRPDCYGEIFLQISPRPCMPETFCFSLVAGTEEEEKSGKAGAATVLGEPVNWVFEWYWPAAATAATNWIDRIKQNWEPNPPTICAQKVLKTSWPNRSSIQYPIPDRKPNLQKNCQYYMHCSVRIGHKSVSFFSLVLYSA